MPSKYKPCLYNKGIRCSKMDADKCYMCGWNPATDRRRKEMIRNGLSSLFSAAVTKNERC